MGFWSTLAGKIILSMLVSMVPIIELRGGVPIAVGMGLDLWLAFVACIIGNMLPVPIILLFLRKVLSLMEKWGGFFAKIAFKLKERAEKKSKALERGQILGLIILVAIPLPGTGAWTGALVASLMNIPPKKAFPAIFIGVVVAGIIMSIVSYGAFKIF